MGQKAPVLDRNQARWPSGPNTGDSVTLALLIYLVESQILQLRQEVGHGCTEGAALRLFSILAVLGLNPGALYTALHP